MSADLAVAEPADPGFEPKQLSLLEALRFGNTRSASYKSAGVSKSTFYRWLTDNETFRDSVERAESAAEVSHVSVIRVCAQGGMLRKRTTRTHEDGSVDVIEEFTEPDWKASAWFLERRRRGEWSDDALNLGQLTDEQIVSLLEDQDQTTGDSAPLEVAAVVTATVSGSAGVVS